VTEELVAAFKWHKHRKGLRADVWDPATGEELGWKIAVKPSRKVWLYSITPPGAATMSAEASTREEASIAAEDLFVQMITGEIPVEVPEVEVEPEPPPPPPPARKKIRGKRQLPDTAFKGAVRPPGAEPFVVDFATSVGSALLQKQNKKLGKLKLRDVFAAAMGPQLPVDLGIEFDVGEGALIFWPGELAGNGLLMAVMYYYHADPAGPPTYEAKGIFDVSDLRVAYRLSPEIPTDKVKEIADWVFSQIKKSA
jgi:hypothetical protein